MRRLTSQQPIIMSIHIYAVVKGVLIVVSRIRVTRNTSKWGRFEALRTSALSTFVKMVWEL
ncbi:hypothetical protein ABIB68_007533 [Bradyrhizobium sp. F1.2.2]